MSFGDPEEARRLSAHEYRRKALSENVQMTTDTAVAALKLCITFNAGGMIALLGFLGALAGKIPKVLDDASFFLSPMAWFGAGLILGGIAMACLFLGQRRHTISLENMVEAETPPYTAHTANSSQYAHQAEVWRRAAMIVGLLSFATFIIGMLACFPLIRSIKF